MTTHGPTRNTPASTREAIAPPGLDRTDWRRGFDLAATGLDCRECGARIGVRPELTDRHRNWHRELTSLFTPTAD